MGQYPRSDQEGAGCIDRRIVSARVKREESNMLGKRFEYNGRSWLPLNQLQSELRAQIEGKLKDGIYRFEDVPCCICDGRDFEALSTRDRYGLYMPVVICRQCGLIQTNPRMTQESYSEFYNAEYLQLYMGEEIPRPYFFASQLEKGRRIFAYLSTQPLSKPLATMSVLEVGCGAGGILHYFKQQGCSVQGIDLGAENVAFGRERYGLNLSRGTIADVRWDVPPDLIIYSHVLEHVLQPNNELQQVRRILPDDGVLYVELPGVKDVRKSCDREFLRYLQNAHTYHFTLTSLKNLLQRNGFELIAGSESINSVFRKRKGEASPAIVNDCPDAMSYLRSNEFRRKLRPPSASELNRWSRSAVLAALKTIGLDRAAKARYEAWKRR
ncbi:MAG: hypothetical protein A2X46_17780 [Lentisphaerae bacterium GWF2_57_35]|nr:MAG: hypothetical protein A2X46_17780 [Lentisphaerae bacterium GWF2_57_35]